MAHAAAERSSPDFHRPNMRIVLLGRSVSENTRVGNFILGRAAFDSEAPTDVVERVGGRLKERHVMLINSPLLLQRIISDDENTQMTVRECVNLSDPGPHVFILVLQHKDFIEEDMERVKYVLKQFSEEAIKHTLLITTDEVTEECKAASVKINECIQQLNVECGGRYLQLHHATEESLSELSQWLDKIMKENNDEFVKCKLYDDDAEELSVDEDKGEPVLFKTHEDSDTKDNEQHQDAQTETKNTKYSLQRIPIIGSYWGSTKQSSKQSQPKNVTRNLVLCGSDKSLKTCVSKLLRRKNENFLINLMELPALSQLSEEEVMHQTLHCLNICDSGVHVFLLVIPAGPLTDEDKAEIEAIQKIFSSRINKHMMILIKQEKHVITDLNIIHTSLTNTSLQTFGGKFVLESSSQVQALLQDVEKMVKLNNGSCYTTLMYLNALVELERSKHTAEIEELRKTMTKTQSKSDVTQDDLRIVLLGKTGVGKSATGNSILRRETFDSYANPSSLTRECQKETTELNGRQITVIDTPGLFDTGVDHVETGNEIVKCISMAAPGPHVFLLVIQVGRFTEEEHKAVKMIQETFGDKSKQYTIVLFTRGDDLGKRNIENYIEQNDSLKNLVQQCGKRYHVFNNKEMNSQKQVSELLDKIDWMLTVNGGSFYSNEMFQQVEKNIKEEQERIIKEKEEEIKKKEEELRGKYEAEIEKMKEQHEKERQEMEYELRKTEEDIKMREEEIKTETNKNHREEMQRKLDEQKKLIEKANEQKEKTLGQQQEKFIKLLEEKHEKDKQKLQEKIQRETREQAERDFSEKLMKEVAKALKENEEKIPYRSKYSRDWSYYVPVAGGAAGGVVGGIQDIVQSIKQIF